MNNQIRQLRRQQLDRIMKRNRQLLPVNADKNWINNIRVSLDMSLAQLGKRLNFSAQAVAKLEKNEQEASITLKSLDKVASSLGLKLVYGFASLPDTSLKKTIARQARKKAREIVTRANQTMSLEKQANSSARLKKAVEERATELANKQLRTLWD